MKNKSLNCKLVYVTDSTSTIWFRGKTVSEILGYVDTDKSIRKFVDDDDKLKLKAVSGPSEMAGRSNNDLNTIFINESGLYSLILSSKLPNAKKFKKWVTSEVLPSIRKSGHYDMKHKFSNKKTININNEFDLHSKCVQFLKRRFPESLFTANLGELQDTSTKRLKSFNMGYIKGSPDLIIHNLNKKYSGLVIEFKGPTGKGLVSDEQTKLLKSFENNGFKTMLTNDYDMIIEAILEYFKDVRIKCQYCSRRFKSAETLLSHHSGFHRHAEN
jgi:prophage antirepressor-like protein